MTKKHFKAIAQTIKSINSMHPNDKEVLIKELSITFQQINPRFDWNKFYDACFE